MSEILRGIKAEARKAEERLKEKVSPKAKRIRVLKLWALGPRDAESLVRWMREGAMIEELLKENMELRARWINLEAKLTVMADRIAARKLARVFKAAREVINGDAGED